MYKIKGKIVDSNMNTIENKKGGDPYEKMLITIEESVSGFNHLHQFEIFGNENIELHKNNIKINHFVEIDFYIKSNKWKDKFFNSLNIKDIRIVEEVTDLINDNLPF